MSKYLAGAVGGDRPIVRSLRKERVMFDLFAAAPEDYRHKRLEEYDAFLQERDGELDLKAWTLAKREASMKRYEAKPASTRWLDAAEFAKQYVAFDRRKPPSPEVTLLLALVKVNAAEAYGVSRGFQRTYNRAMKNGDMSELRLMCEEGYHTRLLLSSSNLYGIEVREPYKPPSALRVLVGGIANLPTSIARPLSLAGEILGTLIFIKMLDVARVVLKGAPEVRDAVEERLVEICVDERGHVSYNRMQMGPAALAETRMLLPVVARSLVLALPEVVATGAFPTRLWEDLPLAADPKRMPSVIREQCFVA
jgi:hypothetical protein